MFEQSTPTLIGLTGGIASGKSTVADYLASLGAYLIDTDVIARQVVTPDSPTTKRIHQLLGSAFFLKDGNLNRSAIKKLIFNDDDIKNQYESIILPAIRQATIKSINNIPKNSCYSLLVVPLLFEKGLNQYTSYNISVDLPTEKQIERAIARRPNDKSVIKKIINSQMPRESRNASADFVINNNQSVEKLYKDLDTLHAKLCTLPAKKALSNEYHS